MEFLAKLPKADFSETDKNFYICALGAFLGAAFGVWFALWIIS